jgi:hypothetical protein
MTMYIMNSDVYYFEIVRKRYGFLFNLLELNL